MATVNEVETINLNSVLYLFNGDFIAIQKFKNLLNAVANNALEDPSSNVSDESLYNYLMVRSQVDTFVKNTIVEKLYISDMYNQLIEGLVDYFSCLITIIYERRSITDVDIQSEDIINEYLTSFGFPSIGLFDSIQKREICRSVYGYLRKKGTPGLIKRLLLQMGFTYFCIIEYWLTHDGSSYIFEPEIISYTSSSETTNDWELFLKNKKYTLNDIITMDPLWLKTQSEINDQVDNGTMTLPAKSPYFQLGVSVSTTDSDKLSSAMLYAIFKRSLYLNSVHEDIKDIRFAPYTVSKLSALDLAYAWMVINEEYGSIYDIFGLNDTNSTNSYDVVGKMRKYDMDMSYDTIGRRSIVKIMHDDGFVFNENGIHYDSYRTDKLITAKVFGWNGNIIDYSIGDILKTIKDVFDSTFNEIKYHPTSAAFNVNLNRTIVNNNRSRFDTMDKFIEDTFIAPALFKDYDLTLIDFMKYNPTFYAWLIELLDSYNGLSDKADKCRYLLSQILVSFENYIFAKTNIRLNLKQHLVSFDNFKKISEKVSNSFAPYHAKMIDPFYIYVIRDLPYDQILIGDTTSDHPMGPAIIGNAKYNNPYWRARYKKIGIADGPDNSSIDITKLYHLPNYDKSNTINVNGNKYEPSFDYENDYVTVKHSNGLLYSGYKLPLSPFEYVTNTKQSFTVEVNDLCSEFILWGKRGTDISSPYKIMKMIPRSSWKPGYNYVVVEESYYVSKYDGKPIYRILSDTVTNATTGMKIDINSFDDPRWRDRFDTIKISKTNSIDVSDGTIKIGIFQVTDIYLEI